MRTTTLLTGLFSLPVCLLVPQPGWAADNAVEFTGDGGDYLELGALDPGTSFTIEGWINVDDWDAYGYASFVEVVDQSTGLNEFYVGYVGDTWQIEIGDDNVWEGDTCESTTVDIVCFDYEDAPAGTDTHVAVAVTPTTLDLFVDGGLVDRETISSSPSFGTALWVLGADTDDGSSFTSDALDGRMDEVRIWSRALTEDEVVCTMDVALTGDEPDVYAHWPMDESSGATTATDSLGVWDATVQGDTDFISSSFGLTASAGYDVGCLDYDGDGWTLDDGDCDETDADVSPDGAEVWYDGTDGDCDGESDYDADGDGHDSDAHGGDDCDDDDGTINPDASDGAYDGVDSDCDGASDYDADGDGHDASAYGGDDCDDTDATVSPDATEVWYDGVDADCDGESDHDADGDGHDASGHGGGDCDDTDAAISPDATEVWYDGVDTDCDGESDYDADGDGHDSDTEAREDGTLGDDCDDTSAAVNPDAPDGYYDGVDSDCDGASDYDADGDGHDSASFGGDDCDDGDADTYPGAPDDPYDGEINDCDSAGEYDADGDGFLSQDHGGTDCDDNNSEINPDATEILDDGIDQDCDGEDEVTPADTGGDTGGDTGDDTGGSDGGVDSGTTGADAGGDDGADTGAGATPEQDKFGSCGCASPAGAPAALWTVGLLALGLTRRRRDATGR